MSVRLIHGDCREVLKTLPDKSVHCVVTSPPYWGLRDYGTAGQLGMETSLGEYLDVMVEVFREVGRVLHSDGTLWLNYGDSYATQPAGNKGCVTSERFRSEPGEGQHGITYGGNKPFSTITADWKSRVGQSGNKGNDGADHGFRVSSPVLKPKDLCGIPWRIAFALQADGWWLRQDIIWSKPNPMPESVTDRCTKAHEYIFLLSKSERYYYDAEAIKEPVTGGAHARGNGVNPKCVEPGNGIKQNSSFSASINEIVSERNKRSVWEVATAPFSEAHFATFPPALIEPCILAGCADKCCATCGAPWVRETRTSGGTIGKSWHNHENDLGRGQRGGDNGKNLAAAGWRDYRRETLGFSPSCLCSADTVSGTVLDPFAGAGTTGLVADRLGRNAILIELNPEYAAMAERRITDDAPLFAQVAAE